MSAALQLPNLWAAAAPAPQLGLLASAVLRIQHRLPVPEPEQPPAEPVVSYAFYRKHTQNLLRRYLYASMQVGRTPNLLSENVGRGWASSRRVRTFEDALIFVLDVEQCLNKLSPLDRQIISRVLLQEYTQSETAVILGVSCRTIHQKLPEAIDRLTEWLVTSDLLLLPD